MYSYPTACEDVPHRNSGVADSVPVLVAGAPPPPVLDVTPALPWWRFESSNVNRIIPPDAGVHDSLPEVVTLITSQVLLRPPRIGSQCFLPVFADPIPLSADGHCRLSTWVAGMMCQD